MNKEKAIKILDMFLHKQCSLASTEFAYSADEVWDAVKMARDELQNTGTYEDGFADAWEAARKIVGMDENIFAEIFDNPFLPDFMRCSTPQEAIAKIKEYEDSKEIRWGDEVTDGIFDGVVTRVRDVITVMWKNGETTDVDKSKLTKTGRNFADRLDALLGEIGGEDEETDLQGVWE